VARLHGNILHAVDFITDGYADHAGVGTLLPKQLADAGIVGRNTVEFEWQCFGSYYTDLEIRMATLVIIY